MSTLSDAIAKQAKEQAAKAKKKTTKKQMKVQLAVLGGLIVLGFVGANIIEGFKNSPTGQVVEQLQERKQQIEDIQKLQLPESLRK